MSFFCSLLALAGAETPSVQIRGHLVQSEPGEVRVEVLVEQGPGQHPLLAYVGFLTDPGPFTHKVPTGLGKVKVRAGLDRKGDGLGPSDPQMVTPLTLNLDAPIIEGVRLEIVSAGK